MKIQVILSLFAYSIAEMLSAQSHVNSAVQLDTIYANEYQNVALFFPEPIRQGIVGSDGFVFTYNREKEQYFGLLQAQPENVSNLLVISTSGTIFSYLVKYRKQLDKLNYFIENDETIGNERRIDIDSSLTGLEESKLSFDERYYQHFSDYLLQKKKPYIVRRSREAGIELIVEEIVFDRNELYFVVEIINNTRIDYDINFIDMYVENRKMGKRKSLQRLYKIPKLKHKIPETIAQKSTVRMTLVLPKFTIANEKQVFLELDEKSGERNVKLKLRHHHINNPN